MSESNNTTESQISVICLAAMELASEAINAGDVHRVDGIKSHALDRVMDVLTDKAEDMQLAQIVRDRADSKRVSVNLEDL